MPATALPLGQHYPLTQEIPKHKEVLNTMDLRSVLLFSLVLETTKLQTLGCDREGHRHFIFFFLLKENQNIDKEPMHQGPGEIVQVSV